MEDYRRSLSRVFKLDEQDIDLLERLAADPAAVAPGAPASDVSGGAPRIAPVEVRGFETPPKRVGTAAPAPAGTGARPADSWVASHDTYTRWQPAWRTDEPIPGPSAREIEFNGQYPGLDRSLAFRAPPKRVPRARTQADLMRDPQFIADADTWVRQEYRDQVGRYRQYLERTPRPNGRDAQRLMWADPEQWSDEKKVAMYMDDIRYMKNSTLGAVRSALTDRPKPVAEALTRGFATHDSLQWGTPEGLAGLLRGVIIDPLTYVPAGRAAAKAIPAIGKTITHAADQWALDTALKNGIKYAIKKPANDYMEDQGADVGY